MRGIETVPVRFAREIRDAMLSTNGFRTGDGFVFRLVPHDGGTFDWRIDAPETFRVWRCTYADDESPVYHQDLVPDSEPRPIRVAGSWHIGGVP